MHNAHTWSTVHMTPCNCPCDTVTTIEKVLQFIFAHASWSQHSIHNNESISRIMDIQFIRQYPFPWRSSLHKTIHSWNPINYPFNPIPHRALSLPSFCVAASSLCDHVHCSYSLLFHHWSPILRSRCHELPWSAKRSRNAWWWVLMIIKRCVWLIVKPDLWKYLHLLTL